MYLRPPVIGNFRPSKEEREKGRRLALSAKKRERPGNDASHLDIIRKLPCCVCGVMPGGDPHHLQSGPARAERGMAQTATDQWAVPACRTHHDAVHALGSQNELAFFVAHGIDALQLATDLWAASGDLPKMIDITITAWTGHEPLEIPGTK